MTASTHPLIRKLTPAELTAAGCCYGAEEARDWSGLSKNELYRLMNAGVLPWQMHKGTRLIPKRALNLILADLFESGAEPVPGACPRTDTVGA